MFLSKSFVFIYNLKLGVFCVCPVGVGSCSRKRKREGVGRLYVCVCSEKGFPQIRRAPIAHPKHHLLTFREKCKLGDKGRVLKKKTGKIVAFCQNPSRSPSLPVVGQFFHILTFPLLLRIAVYSEYSLPSMCPQKSPR